MDEGWGICHVFVLTGIDIFLYAYSMSLQAERQSVRREDDLDRVRNLEKQIAQVDAEIGQQ
jgi:hypothetical protein